MTIAVTGATGQLGRIVVEKLKSRTTSGLVALVRSPEKATDLGIEARRADYDDEKSLEDALGGIETLLLISSSEIGKRTAQHRNAIEAAKKNGVKRIVYTSLLRADTSPLSIAAEHAETESELKSSGIEYTILRNGWYTENYTGALEGAIAAGVLIGSGGEGRISGASREDYAEAAVAVLTTPGHEGKVYELAGDESFSLGELAAEVSQQTGREIPYKDLPEPDYTKALEGFGLPAGLAAMIADCDTAARDGALHHEDRELSKLIGRPTTPLAQTVKAALA